MGLGAQQWLSAVCFEQLLDQRADVLGQFVDAYTTGVTTAVTEQVANAMGTYMNAVMAESIRFTPRALARRIAGSLQKARTP